MVKQLLGLGHTQVQIAGMLGLSARTVSRYKNTYPSRKAGRQTHGASQAPNTKGGNKC